MKICPTSKGSEGEIWKVYFNFGGISGCDRLKHQAFGQGHNDGNGKRGEEFVGMILKCVGRIKCWKIECKLCIL